MSHWCETWVIDVRHAFMWDVMHSKETWLMHMTCDSCVCNMTHAYATWLIDKRHDSLIRDVTHWYVWHDSLIRDTTHWYETWLIDRKQNSLIRVSMSPLSLSHVSYQWVLSHWVMSHMNVRQTHYMNESCLIWCNTRLIDMASTIGCLCVDACALMPVRWCRVSVHVRHLYVWAQCVMCDMTHWHESYLDACVLMTWLIRV